MKKSILNLLLLFISGSTLLSQQTHVVNSVGFTFSPDNLSISAGDTVHFQIAGSHNIVEVSQATWNANGNTSNGGFSLGFGGGKIKLNNPGTYYYVCSPHSGSGMKGIIIVNPTNISENDFTNDVKVYPTRPDNFVNVDFTLQNSKQVKIEVYSVLGEKVYTYSQNNFSSGNHKVQIDVTNLLSGAYFVKIYDERFAKTVRIIK